MKRRQAKGVMASTKIGRTLSTRNVAPVIVAEIGINHCGSIILARAMIAMAKELGADYVKFQKRTVDKVYTRRALDKPKFSPWGTKKYHEKLGLEFGRPEYDEIDRCSNLYGIKWFASPWDVESIAFLTPYNLPFYKVASACVTHHALLEGIAASGVPSILSTGMSRIADIDTAVRILNRHGNLRYLLHCCSEYPASDSHMNMRALETLRTRYGDKVKIGFSNHNQRITYMEQAYVLGAEMVELHVVLDKQFPGDDQMASIDPSHFHVLMENIRSIEAGWGSGDIEDSMGDLAKARQYAWKTNGE